MHYDAENIILSRRPALMCCMLSATSHTILYYATHSLIITPYPPLPSSLEPWALFLTLTVRKKWIKKRFLYLQIITNIGTHFLLRLAMRFHKNRQRTMWLHKQQIKWGHDKNNYQLEYSWHIVNATLKRS